MKKKLIGLYIPEELLAEVKSKAKDDEHTLSSVIRALLKKWVGGKVRL